MNTENPQLIKVGQLPGAITYTGKDKSNKITIELMTYDKDSFDCKELDSIEQLNLENDDKLKWIKITGLNNEKVIKEIGDKLELNELILQDIINTNHIPKVEFHNNFIFLILKIISFYVDNMRIKTEHASFVLFENTLVSFQEYENDVFDYRERTMKEDTSLIRKRKIDYLLYSLADAIVDDYFIVVSDIEEKMEELEIKIMDKEDAPEIYIVYKLRKEMLRLKKLVWPIESTIKTIVREDDRVNEENVKYFREISDNLIQLMDFINMDRDVILGIFDLYLSNNDNRMNKTMQTLTVVATIFTPLTFLTGVYGMNFKYMPELNSKVAYSAFWFIALLNFVVLYRYYKKKGWI